MRSTRAASAVERLNRRAETQQYSMLKLADERLQLIQRVAGKSLEKIGQPLELDDFVAFVNAHGPQTPRRVSKLDVQFEKNMRNKKSDAE